MDQEHRAHTADVQLLTDDAARATAAAAEQRALVDAARAVPAMFAFRDPDGNALSISETA